MFRDLGLGIVQGLAWGLYSRSLVTVGPWGMLGQKGLLVIIQVLQYGHGWQNGHAT